MEKMFVFGMLAIMLIAGCVTPPQEVGEDIIEEELAEELEDLITISGSEDVRIVTIKTVNERFPLSEYEDEFLSVGLHSDSFIQLNNSHMELLDENEAIWLTPMIKDNKGVLFNAIYSKDIEDCTAEQVTIIGKEYALAELKNDSSFEFDDKWKIALDYENTCLKRIVIYMDGHFYDLENNDQISIFRNDNTVLLKFKDLETSPEIDLIATKPLEVKKN